MRRRIFLIGLALICGLTALRAADPDPVRALRLTYFDYLQRLSPRDWQDLPVRVVDIDETALAQHGQWPWPRSKVAELVTRLEGYGVAAVGFDVLFSEPDRYSPVQLLRDPALARFLGDAAVGDRLAPLDTDRQFANTMQTLPTVLGVAARPTEQVRGAIGASKAGFVEIGAAPLAGVNRVPAWTPLLPDLQAAASGIGNINVSPSGASGLVRQVPLVWAGPDGYVPSLGLETLRVAMGESTYIARGLGDLDGALESIQLAGYRIPTTGRGEFWLHFRPDDPRLYLSAADVLARGDAPEVRAQLDGQIVLVGTSAAGLLDIRSTPLGENVPGVSIHAQMIEQVLTDSYLRRSDFTAGLELFAFAILALLVTLVMTSSGPVLSMLAGAGAGMFLLAASWFAFQRGVLLDAAFPVLAGALNFTLLAGYQFIVADREKRMVRRSFSQYLAPSVLGEIERSGYKIELGGEMRDITVMFADIRNFTPLSESLPASELVSLLNDLFTELSQDILDHEGTIDKYIGDSVMAFWNVPLPLDGHEAEAAKAALMMRHSLRRFVESRDALSAPIELATGIASGEALVGNIGSRQRFNYSALGDTVNVAARIEGACRQIGYDIVAAAGTRDAAPDLAWLFAGKAVLKGKSTRQALYVLVGDADLAASARFKALADAHEVLLRDATDPKALAACQRLAARVEQGLPSFYARIPTRAADFQAG